MLQEHPGHANPGIATSEPEGGAALLVWQINLRTGRDERQGDVWEAALCCRRQWRTPRIGVEMAIVDFGMAAIHELLPLRQIGAGASDFNQSLDHAKAPLDGSVVQRSRSVLVLRVHIGPLRDEPKSCFAVAVGASGDQRSVVPHPQVLEATSALTEELVDEREVALLHGFDQRPLRLPPGLWGPVRGRRGIERLRSVGDVLWRRRGGAWWRSGTINRNRT
mmetsp:Transcript_121272/g.258853  ORF Transcript_121272/g.258853 Transcript_121272/m.258853 type:complete len:221 (+) Transcript_121272:561-1223(+)